LPNPVLDIDVQLALRRMARKNGRINKQAYGLNKKLFDDLMQATGDDIFGIRDRALLQLGYASLCRRHELVQLLAEDIKSNEDGSVLLHQRSGKTDTEKRGRWIYLPLEVWNYVRTWLEAANIKEGPILRGINRGGRVMSEAYGPGAINRTYKRLARRAGFDEALVAELSSHSTRVGAAQELLRTGASLLQVMQRGGWGLPQSVIYRFGQKENQTDTQGWLNQLTQRRNKNVAAVALANKNARIVWALLNHNRDYQDNHKMLVAA
jgi:integrase